MLMLFLKLYVQNDTFLSFHHLNILSIVVINRLHRRKKFYFNAICNLKVILMDNKHLLFIFAFLLHFTNHNKIFFLHIILKAFKQAIIIFFFQDLT